ncbi:hypothetical protein A8B82_08260 [Sulfitobacter sp. EhC04]|uniref:carboxymuconolactone decarboxylase family protein n=1 Tax=Sulfitobacter sp. EhC04 TaxID=1849168 RepID=UPI0007F32D45|nr:carboxymuconolactone decarboxylase family protein [Sulfitobacter sp. EhC04]OAN79370.1 hypothetical protein A8B82_08260 [Sulfitobacter sp. EhC04]
MTDATLIRGRAHVAEMNPGLEAALAGKYDDLVPGMSESLIDWAYGQHYTRDGLDNRTRQLCTVAALVSLGGWTGPQLKVNIEHTLAAGANPREIVEAIWQMSVYAGMPAAINGLNAALEVFDAAKS